MTTTRRMLLGATAAFAAAPAVAIAATTPPAAVAAPVAAAAAAGASDIRGLWDKVIDLSIRMNAHAHEMAKADRGTGLPGWMYVSGEANDLGNARYDALIEILKSKPETAEDLTIMARAAAHDDLSCSKTFSHACLTSAVMNLQAA